MKRILVTLLAAMALTTACDLLENMNNNEQDEQVCDKCGEDPCVCADATCPDCGKNPCECATPNPDFTPLQPSAQKQKLSDTGQHLMEKFPASEWETYAQLMEDINKSVYASEDYNWGTLEDWFEEELEEGYKDSFEENTQGNVITRINTSEILIFMANHTGLFECTENGVVIKDYNGGTKATFSLNGKSYEAEISSEGKITEAIYVWEEQRESFSSDIDGDGRTDNTQVNSSNTLTVKVGVPEKIIVSLKENGTSLMNIEVGFTPSFTKEGIDITTDSFSTTVIASINGFEFSVNKAAYNAATGKAETKTTISKNGEVLFTTSASADVNIKVEQKTWEDSWESWDGSQNTQKRTYTYIYVEKAQDITVRMDILGEIQAKGTCSNAMEVNESLELMWDALYDGNTANETEARRHLNNANSKMDINIYYDGTSTKQASIKYDLICQTYYDWEDWDLIPVIVFNDSSTYKVEEFFTEEAFSTLIDNFYDFCESFGDVFGIEKDEDLIEQEQSR